MTERVLTLDQLRELQLAAEHAGDRHAYHAIFIAISFAQSCWGGSLLAGSHAMSLCVSAHDAMLARLAGL